ncbi:CS1 type fimbrial major subunit [Pinirhizobacter soli]|uniref:CS1 type fimbrial major subunit n=1 Tax=Pinirhizobacter soli TaxID=2786953 RepID=UPI002029DFE0|nr:CS1 type fimbrial major subunit [Pinirhizobacter soli]
MKINPIALALCLGLAPIAAAAAAPVEQLLKFKTVLPADDFKIAPTTAWPAATATTDLAYDKTKDTFTAYTNQVGITSATQNVTARLENTAALVAGPNSIPVEVKLGGKVLTTTAQQIHPKGAAEVKYPLNIIPTGKGHVAGTYTGEVVLIFDGV